MLVDGVPDWAWILLAGGIVSNLIVWWPMLKKHSNMVELRELKARFEKWHHSLPSYKEPKHYTVKGRLVINTPERLAKHQAKKNAKRDRWQDPTPEYAQE